MRQDMCKAICGMRSALCVNRRRRMARGVRRARHALDRELIDLRHAHALVPRQVVELAPRRTELAHLLGAHVVEHGGELLETEADAARDRLAGVSREEESVLVVAHLARDATGRCHRASSAQGSTRAGGSRGGRWLRGRCTWHKVCVAHLDEEAQLRLGEVLHLVRVHLESARVKGRGKRSRQRCDRGAV